MNLINFADFLPPWIRRFFHILLTDFPRFTGAFFLSVGFPFIIKLFYYQVKLKYCLVQNIQNKIDPNPSSVHSLLPPHWVIPMGFDGGWVFYEFPVRWLKREWTWLNSRISFHLESADFFLFSLRIFPASPEHFSFSRFSLHNKNILLPRKTYLHPKSPAQYLIVIFAVK